MPPIGDAAPAGVPIDIVDIWVTVVTPEPAQRFTGASENQHIPAYLGSSRATGLDAGALLAVMDSLGVATGIIATDLGPGCEEILALAEAHPGRLLVAGGPTDPSRPTRNMPRVRSLSEHPPVRDGPGHARRHRSRRRRCTPLPRRRGM